MRRGIAICSLCLAWLCANGALWDAVQVFAWVKMVNDYSRFMPFSKAVEITFDGSAPCEICHVVAKATKETPGERQIAPERERIVLACVVPEKIVLDVPQFPWPEGEDMIGLVCDPDVPVPPPRC